MSDTTHNNETDSAEDHGHPKPKYDDVNIPVVVLLAVLSAILTFVSIAFVQGLYYNWQESMVQADWNSRSLTPQEKIIVDQKVVRDGFYETKDGKIYVSVDAAARKMIQAAKSPKTQNSTPEPKKEEPGNGKADAKKSEPPKGAGVKKADSPVPPGPEAKSEKPDGQKTPSQEKSKTEAKTPVKGDEDKTGDKK